MKNVGLVATLLVVVGALMGYSDWNLVQMLLGSWPVVANLVYVLVGLSGLWLLWDWYAKMGK